MKKLSLVFTTLALLMPLATSAVGVVDDCGGAGTIGILLPTAFCNVIPGFGEGPAYKSTASGLIIEVIGILLFVVGLLSVLFIIIGGFRYVTAAGNEENAEAAKKTLLHAILGLAIVILSFVMVRIISNALVSGRA